MTVLRALSAAALVAWVASACDPGLSLEQALEGKRCRAEAPRCLEGYVCASNDTCVLAGAIAAAGTGSAPPTLDADVSDPIDGNAGTGGVGGATAGGAGGEDGSSADPPPGGSAGSTIDGGGTGGSEVAAAADAGSIQPVPVDAGPCVPGPLFRDLDGDGHGSGPEVNYGCPEDGLAATDDDCHDSRPTDFDPAHLVYPGQTEYFGVGYRDERAPGNISFDYDCENGEESDPTNDPDDRAQACGELPPEDLTCVGTGYEPNDRGGLGINSLCGSTFIITCVPSETTCESNSVPAETPFRCR